jgi:hypothetical protein
MNKPTIPVYDDPSKSPLARIVNLLDVLTKPLEAIKTGPNEYGADMVLCITSEALLTYTNLWKATSDNSSELAAATRSQLTAFYARNLLELWVWIRYCTASEANAIRFNQDARRDVDGMYLVVARFAEFVARSQDNIDHMRTSLPDLYKYLEQVDEIVTRDVKFKTVNQVAEELGAEVNILYKTLNKLLSKFIHPTALMVRAIPDAKRGGEIANMFLIVGTSLCLDLAQQVGAYAKALREPEPAT